MSRSRNDRERGKGTPAHPQTQPLPPASNDVVPGRFNEHDWGFMLEDESNEDFVIDILYDVVNAALDVVHNKIIQSRIIPYTVDAARELIIHAIEWQFMVSDPGESHPERDPTWLEDEEPSPSVTDSWAQGAVPVIHLADVEAINEEVEEEREDIKADIIREGGETTEQTNADDKESSESRSNDYTLDKETDINQSSKSENELPSENARQKEIVPKPPSCQPPHSRFSQKRKVDFKPYRGKMPPFKPITLTPVTDEWAPKGHLNGNLSLEENAANYSSSESPGNKNQRFPRSKDVTYDQRGNIVSVQKLDVERLPSHRIRTKFSIIDPVEEEYKARLASKKNRYNFLHNNSNNNTDNNLQNLATFHKPTVYKRMVESQATVDRDADQVTPLPPPLVDSITVSPGVVIKEGGIVKRGAKKNSMGKHQTDVSQLHPLGSSVVAPTLQVRDVIRQTSPLVRPLNSTPPLPAIPSSGDR